MPKPNPVYHPEVIPLLPDSDQTCFIVPRLFSPEQCRELLEPALQDKFRAAASDYPTYYRNNDRYVCDSDELAAMLFNYVKPHLPDTLVIHSGPQEEQGTWTLQEINSRIRFCRYKANQYFHRHLDGVHHRSATVQSKLTFMIYLNDASDFEGGRTLFYRGMNDSACRASYIPQQGDLMVFDHNLWHEGEEVLSGEKFVLRSDILYTRTGVPAVSTQHLGYIWKIMPFDVNTLISAGRDKYIRVWNAEGALRQEWEAHSHSILCLEKINDTLFISGSRDRTIRKWELQPDGTFTAAGELRLHKAVVLTLCRLNETQFASAGGDAVVKIADISRQLIRELYGHTNWVWQVLRLSEALLVTCSEDHSVRIWNYETGRQLHEVTDQYPVTALAYDAGTQQLACGNLAGEITIYHIGTSGEPAERLRVKTHEGLIRTLLFIPGNRLASGGEDNCVRIMNTTDGLPVAEFKHGNFVQSLALASGNVLQSASYDGTIRSWIFPE